MRQVRAGAIEWRMLVPAAALSLVTMPFTGIWFLALGGVVMVVAGFLAAFRQPEPASGLGSTGLGLLLGPAVYLALAVIA